MQIVSRVAERLKTQEISGKSQKAMNYCLVPSPPPKMKISPALVKNY